MDAEKFAHYIKNPAHLYQITYTELKSLVLQFPYCQNLRYLLLQKSILENHKEKDQNLQLAATYSLDRKLLYQQIKAGESFVSESDNFIIKEDYLELKELNDVPDYPDQTNSLSIKEEPVETESLLFEPELTEVVNPAPEKEEPVLPIETEKSSRENLFYDDLMDDEEEELEDITSEMEGIFIDTNMEEILEKAADTGKPGEANSETLEADVLEQANIFKEEDDSISIEELIKLDNLTPLERLEKSVAERRSKKKKNKAAKEKSDTPKKKDDGFTVEDLDQLSANDQPDVSLEVTNKEDIKIKEDKTGKSKDKSSFGSWLKQFQPPEEIEKKTKKKKKSKTTKSKKSSAGKKEKTKAESNKSKESPVNPKIVAEKSLKENEEIVSEPLAKLLVKQGSYKKAIRMYKKLSLIFPEKSSFFAEQIENLKNL